MFFLPKNILGKGEIKFTDKKCTVLIPAPDYGTREHGADIVIGESGKKECSKNTKHVFTGEKCSVCGAEVIVNLDVRPAEKFCSENSKHKISPKE